MDILPLGADDLVNVTGVKSIFPKVALEKQEEMEAELNQKFGPTYHRNRISKKWVRLFLTTLHNAQTSNIYHTPHPW